MADQMGLGKTLTMISLIALHPAQVASSLVFTAQGTIRRIKTTLIVVPFPCGWFVLRHQRAFVLTLTVLATWHAQLQQ